MAKRASTDNLDIAQSGKGKSKKLSSTVTTAAAEAPAPTDVPAALPTQDTGGTKEAIAFEPDGVC